MQRFVRIGSTNVQFLSAMMHDGSGAQRVTHALEALRPEAVLVDRSVKEWTRPSTAEPLQKVITGALPGLHANALWQAVGQAAPQLGAEIVVLHEDVPQVSGSAIRKLGRMVKKEGFDGTGDPSRDLAKFHRDYVARVPEIWQALETRRDHTAARIRAMFETRPRRAVVVLAYPDADIICDRIQAMR